MQTNSKLYLYQINSYHHVGETSFFKPLCEKIRLIWWSPLNEHMKEILGSTSCESSPITFVSNVLHRACTHSFIRYIILDKDN